MTCITDAVEDTKHLKPLRKPFCRRGYAKVSLWLGHESPVTTHHYVEADLAMKERALARLQEPSSKILRYRAPDALLNFLRTL